MCGERRENDDFQFPIVENWFEVEAAQSYGLDCIYLRILLYLNF